MFEKKKKYGFPQWNFIIDWMIRDQLRCLHGPPGGRGPPVENPCLKVMTRWLWGGSGTGGSWTVGCLIFRWRVVLRVGLFTSWPWCKPIVWRGEKRLLSSLGLNGPTHQTSRLSVVALWRAKLAKMELANVNYTAGSLVVKHSNSGKIPPRAAP